MILIDTHSHVYVAELEPDREVMLHRAKQAGIKRILMPAIDTATHQAQLALEAAYPDFCISMMGVHPCSIKENYKDELKAAAQWLEKRKFVAIGEIGLDFYWDKTFIGQQYEAFHQQLEWALHYNIPVSIHSRNATDECIAVVQEHQKGKLKGVFHCFSGTAEQAKKAIDLGFYLGIGGVVTFKNSGLDKVLEDISLQHIVLETDAPYLAPVPYRGKRNEPAYLRLVADKLAALKNTTAADVSAVTTENAEKLFGI